ncbi:MAG: 6-bladed beta-propeller [Gemmatimonadota bacterium]
MSSRIALVIVLYAAGCVAESDEVAVSSMVRDSAGVAIVSSVRPQWLGSTAAWTVQREAIVSIGGGNDNEYGHLIWQVTGAAVTANGAVLVLSGGRTAPRLYLFSRDGTLIRAIGGAGDGPGEFREPLHLQFRRGDTIAVWERFFGRVTSFDTAGTVVGIRHIDFSEVVRAIGAPGEKDVAVPLDDGSFIARIPLDQELPAVPTRGQWLRTPVRYSIMRVDYSTHSLGEFDDMMVGYAPGETARPVVPLFGVRSAIAAGDFNERLKIYVSTGDRNEVRQFDSTGRLAAILRLESPPPSVTDRERKLALERIGLFNNMDETAIRRREQMLETFPEQSHHPPMRSLLLDRLGYLWALEKNDGLWETVWHVFDPTGAWLGRVHIPLFRVYEIGPDYVIGSARDSLLVESVRVHALLRGVGKTAILSGNRAAPRGN